MKRIIFGPNRSVGRCNLPLDWFPTNRIVREWFPITNAYGRDDDPAKAMLLLDVHVDTRGTGPFKAAFSNLRVVPTWPRPVDDRTECPAPPQVIFVVPETADGGATRYAPVATIQYPTTEMLAGRPPAPQYYTAQPGCQSWEQDMQYYPSVGITVVGGGSIRNSGMPPGFS